MRRVLSLSVPVSLDRKLLEHTASLLSIVGSTHNDVRAKFYTDAAPVASSAREMSLTVHSQRDCPWSSPAGICLLPVLNNQVGTPRMALCFFVLFCWTFDPNSFMYWGRVYLPAISSLPSMFYVILENGCVLIFFYFKGPHLIHLHYWILFKPLRREHVTLSIIL